FVDLVERLERWHTLWKVQPRQLAPREDVHIGPDRFRLVERPGTNEQVVAGRTVIAAPYVGSALAAEEHLVIFPAASFECECLRDCPIRFHEFPLDPNIDHERAPGNALAISAVTGMNDEGTGRQLVPHSCARTTTF